MRSPASPIGSELIGNRNKVVKGLIIGLRGPLRGSGKIELINVAIDSIEHLYGGIIQAIECAQSVVLEGFCGHAYISAPRPKSCLYKCNIL